VHTAKKKICSGLLTALIAASALWAEHRFGSGALAYKAGATAALALVNLAIWFPEMARFFNQRR